MQTEVRPFLNHGNQLTTSRNSRISYLQRTLLQTHASHSRSSLSLAAQLYSQGIIASAVKEQMSVLGLPRLEKNNVFLNAVAMQIQTDPSVLHIFLATLNEDPSVQSLVESMQSKFFM